LFIFTVYFVRFLVVLLFFVRIEDLLLISVHVCLLYIQGRTSLGDGELCWREIELGSEVSLKPYGRTKHL